LLAALPIGAWPPVAALRLSPLTVGIVRGGFYASTLRGHLTATRVRTSRSPPRRCCSCWGGR